MPEATKLTPDQERRIAAHAHLDPRTVRARLAGRPQASTTRARVDEALRALGFSPPAAPPPEGAR
jgi:DNA-binding LacI/PurR family transcriptional regulator